MSELPLYTLRREDSDDRVRFQTAEALAMLGDERIYPKLWTMLISAYADDRVMGVKAMRQLGTLQARDAIATMLDDDVIEVRLAAAEQLGMLNDTRAEPVVIDVFARGLAAGLDKQSQVRVNVRLALAIGQIRSQSLIRFLPQLLKPVKICPSCRCNGRFSVPNEKITHQIPPFSPRLFCLFLISSLIFALFNNSPTHLNLSKFNT